MRVRMELKGLRQAQREINRRLSRIKNVPGQALVDCSLDLWRKSNKRAPRKYGDLRGSAHVEFNGQELARGEHSPESLNAPRLGNVTVVEFGYDVPYAARLHELPEFREPTTPGTMPKWLEITFTENTERYLKYVERKALEAAEKP